MAPNRSPELRYTVMEPAAVSCARLRIYAGGALCLAATVCGFALALGPRVDWQRLLLLGVLLIAAEHRDRLFGDETSASGSIVIAMSAVVVFSSGAWLAGPMLCAGLAGVYWPHIRSSAWSRIAVNTASMSLAAATAAALFHFVGSDVHKLDGKAAAAGTVALLGFWLVNCLALGIAVALIQRRALRGVFRGLVRSETELLVFAYAGFLLGYVVSGGLVWIGALSLVGVLGVLDLVVMRRTVFQNHFLRVVWPGVAVSAALGVVLWVVVTEGRPTSESFAVLVGLSLATTFAATRRRERFSNFAGLVILIAAATTASDRGTLITALVVGLLASIVPASRRGIRSTGLLLVGSGGLSALAAAGTSIWVLGGMDTSPAAALYAGVAGGLAGFVAWHAVLGVKLALDQGLGALTAVVGVMRGDLGFVLLAGACGGASGWMGTRWGIAGLATALVVVLLSAWLLAGRWKRALGVAESGLTDDDLRDVLQSAVLDLPASRLPD